MAQVGRNIRERKCNVKQKLLVTNIDDLEDDGEAPESAAVNEEKEKGLKSKSMSNVAVKEEDNVVQIPIPDIVTLDDYYTNEYIPWKPPHPYIKFFINNGSFINTEFDYYDLLHDDVVWLDQYNNSMRGKLPEVSEDMMEKLLQMFEWQSAMVTKEVNPVPFYPITTAREDAKEMLELTDKNVDNLYEYWCARRKAIQKQLMRKFQPPPTVGGPHVAFLSRGSLRRTSARNPKQNDVKAYHSMKKLKGDFEQLLGIMDTLKKRELIKRNQLMVAVEEFDTQLSETAWGKTYAPQVAATVAMRESRARKLDAVRAEKAANAVKHTMPTPGPNQQLTYPLFKRESADFPGFWLGPLDVEGEAYSVHQLKMDSRYSEVQNLGNLLVSNVPRSEYVGFPKSDSDDDDEVVAHKGGRKKKSKGKGGGRGGGGRTASNRRNSKMGEDEESSDASEVLTEDTSDEEYFQSVEQHLDREGHDTEVLQVLPKLSFPMTAIYDAVNEIAPSMMLDDHYLQSQLLDTDIAANISATAAASLPAISEKASSSSITLGSPTAARTKLHPSRKRPYADSSYAGFFRGRVGRSGRMMMDVKFNSGVVAMDMEDSTDDESLSGDEPDLDVLDAAFVLQDGVVVKPTLAMEYVRGAVSYTIPT